MTQHVALFGNAAPVSCFIDTGAVGMDSARRPYCKLTAGAVLSHLQQQSMVCVVGYGLSYEAGAPNFSDIISGVWSGPPGRIDPFGTKSGKEDVLHWFEWRRHLISKAKASRQFLSLARFQRTFSLPVISQCVDGLADFCSVGGLLEPYGNVFGKRCIDCGHALPPTVEAAHAAGHRAACAACGGSLFPDVAMFGWNGKDGCLAAAESCIAGAVAIIQIGADSTLFPFAASRATGQCSSTLEVRPDGFWLINKNEVYRASAEELARDFEAVAGKRIAVPDGSPYESKMLFLLGLKEAAAKILGELGSG